MLKQICECGFEIGNHGYNHKDHDKLTYEHNKQEILATHEIVKRITGIEMKLFAPPSGAYNQTTLDVASQMGYKTIMWSHDTIDWRDKDEDLIFERATKNTVGGDLILMHPTLKTKNCFDKIDKTLKQKGLEITTVSNVLSN